MVQDTTEVMNMRIRREAVARDMAQRKLDASAKGTFPFFRFDIEREYHLLRKFRRDLFVVELGEQAAAELEKVKRIKAASHNAGMDPTETLLFERLIKARLNAVLEVATTSPTKKKQCERNKGKCQYCKKKRAGGLNACRKRKADMELAKAVSQQALATSAQPPPIPPQSTTTRKVTKRKKVKVTNSKTSDDDP